MKNSDIATSKIKVTRTNNTPHDYVFLIQQSFFLSLIKNRIEIHRTLNYLQTKSKKLFDVLGWFNIVQTT